MVRRMSRKIQEAVTYNQDYITLDEVASRDRSESTVSDDCARRRDHGQKAG
jgi:hypothetical protein